MLVILILSILFFGFGMYGLYSTKKILQEYKRLYGDSLGDFINGYK